MIKKCGPNSKSSTLSLLPASRPSSCPFSEFGDNFEGDDGGGGEGGGEGGGGDGGGGGDFGRSLSPLFILLVEDDDRDDANNGDDDDDDDADVGKGGFLSSAGGNGDIKVGRVVFERERVIG